MAETKRIMANEAVEAYRETGMTLSRGEYISDDGDCGCAMGVFAVARLGFDRRPPCAATRVVWTLEDAGYSCDYQRGFFHGFDGRILNVASKQEEFVFGYEDGKAAYDAVKEAVNG